ncbi:MAG: replication initiation factor domain-containing protein [Oscillospiraceae bacterium]|nr:replication initiation factor domain-containing protein [Oscillospiraceae bacterium]
MDSEKDIVLYDWLSFTTKIHTPEEVIEALGLTHVPFQEIKGAHGYRDRKYFSSISIHYNGREGMGVWCEMSGQGCRTFETLSQVTWDELFSWITGNGLKITRLDVAFDDHSGVFDMRDVIEDTQEGNYVSKSDYWETVLSSKGSTVMIGSPQSKVVIRIYDKAREKHCPEGTHWNRVELQLRDDRARQFTQIPLPIGEAFSGVLLNYLRYVIPNDTDDNRWRWEMTSYWLRVLEILTPISIFTAPGMEYNIDRCRDYVINQAGNAIDCLIQIYGLNEFKAMIDNRNTAKNPKYTALVKQHYFDRLCAKVDRFFGGLINGTSQN